MREHESAQHSIKTSFALQWLAIMLLVEFVEIVRICGVRVKKLGIAFSGLIFFGPQFDLGL